MPTVIARVAVSLSLLCVLAGCSVSVPDLGSDPVIPEETAPAEEPVAEGPSPTSLTFGARDSQGYTADISFSIDPLSYEADPTDAPPGFTDLSTALNVSTVGHNTTADRAATPVVAFEVLSVYELASPVCRLSVPLDAELEGFEGPAAFHSGAYCFFTIGFQSGGGDVPADGDFAFSGGSGGPLYSPTESNFLSVPEPVAPDMVAALNAPAGFAILPNYGAYGSDVTWKLDNACAMEVVGRGSGSQSVALAAFSSSVCPK